MRETGLRSVWSRVGGLAIHARASAWPVGPDAPVAVLVHGYVVSSAYMVPTAWRLRPGWRFATRELSALELRRQECPRCDSGAGGTLLQRRAQRSQLNGQRLDDLLFRKRVVARGEIALNGLDRRRRAELRLVMKGRCRRRGCRSCGALR